jgi:drug/metabolite transporter (DMT)-like permease
VGPRVAESQRTMAAPIPVPPADGRRTWPSDAVPALLSALTFGASVPVGEHVFRGVGRWFAAGWLYASAGLALAFLLTVRGLASPRATTPGAARRAPLALVAATVCGACLAPYALLRGLESIPKQSASLLLNLETAMTPAIAVWLFRERLSPRRWGGVALVIAGGVVCAIATGAALAGSAAAGAAWVALACVLWAVDSNLGRLLVHREPLAVARDKGLLGGAISLGIAAAAGETAPSTSVLAAGAAVGFVGFGVSVALYFESLRRTTTAVTGALFGTAPFAGVLVAWVAFGERPGTAFAVAVALCAAGVALLLAPVRCPRDVGAAPPVRGG